MPYVTNKHETMRLAFDAPDDGPRMDVLNPYNGDVVGTIPLASVETVNRAFEVAAAYQPKLTRAERAKILRNTADQIRARRDEIADLITSECGLSKADSTYETGRSTDVFDLSANMTIIDDGQIFSCDITEQGKARKIMTTRQPLTAISAITPFNHPLNQVAHKIAPSVATNNCMVLKPTEKTPLTALLLADMLYDAGLPREMFQVITGDPREIGDTMLTHPLVDLVTFTGGVPIGKHIAETAGYKRTVLELGGNDPIIVMDDADLKKAATLAVTGATKNSGQRCTAVKRILVLDSVADEFVAHCRDEVEALVCGDPMDPASHIGTVIEERAAIEFERRVEDAVKSGATRVCGGQRDGALFPPVLLDHVPADCEVVREETFGPVVPVIRCKDLDEVIQVSNSTAYGLSSGVCTDSWTTIQRLQAELKVGTLNVWEVPGYRIEMSPFGGIKDSGLGYKEGVIEAMKSFTNIKTLSLPWTG